MTNVTRKSVWAIVLGALAVATVIFFAWATSGFRNWDAASWFNYWGKGKVVRVTEPPAEQHAMALMSSDSDNSLVHDSDDTTITFALTKLPAPSYDWKSDGLHVYTQGTHVAGGKLQVRYAGFCWGDTLKTFTYTNGGDGKSEEFVVSYDEFNPSSMFAVDYNNTPRNSNGLYLKNLAVTNYTNSDEINIPLFATSGELNLTMSGTKITFNNICPLDSEEVSHPSNSSYYWRGGCKINITASNGKTCNYDFTRSLNANNFVTLYDGVYTVDLTKLSFIDDIVDVATVQVVPFMTCTVGANESKSYTGFGWIDPIYFSISKLTAPTGLQYDAGTLTWNTVSGANSYGVFWTDKQGVEQQAIVTSPTYSFDLNELGEGEHTVRVRALGNLGETLAASEDTVMELSAYNASTTVTQLVALTYNVNGDTVIKFVPYGKNIVDYCYDVSMPNKEFGGWYYDDGFSRKVEKTDVLSGDTVIYARLSDKKVVEHNPTWWDQYKWYVIGGIIGIVVLGIIAAAAIGIRKRKAA